MTDKQKRFLGAVIRWGLMWVVAKLTRGHALPDSIQQLLGPAIDELVEQILALSLSLLVLLWSLIVQWINDLKLKIAAALPGGSSTADVNSILKRTNPGLTKIP